MISVCRFARFPIGFAFHFLVDSGTPFWLLLTLLALADDVKYAYEYGAWFGYWTTGYWYAVAGYAWDDGYTAGYCGWYATGYGWGWNTAGYCCG